MAANDWAIVAGVKHYPGLPKRAQLVGPENDARAFHSWVIDPTGGAVPRPQAALILSTDKDADSPQKATPTAQAFEEEFDKLWTLGRNNGGAFRRLYVYLSGHGFAPIRTESVLLTANAREDLAYHIAAKSYLTSFLNAGIFQEVVLFMDCCRERFELALLRPPPYPGWNDVDAIDKSRRFYGFATRWSHLAREKPFPDGETRGVFTVALLEGLRGAAPDQARANTKVTTRSLGDYLYLRMEGLLTPEEKEAGGQVPDIEYDNDPAKAFVLADVPAPQAAAPTLHEAVIKLRPEYLGGQLEVLSGKPPVLALQLPVAALELKVQLPAGLHHFRVTGTAALDYVILPAASGEAGNVTL